jgi:hypothetical protein
MTAALPFRVDDIFEASRGTTFGNLKMGFDVKIIDLSL